MLKKIVTVSVLVGALALAGCKTTDSGASPTTPPAGQQAAEIIGKVQEETRRICKFVPTAQTVASLLRVFGVGDVSGLLAVAQEVCKVVGTPTNAASRRATGPKKLKGVEIRGTYAR